MGDLQASPRVHIALCLERIGATPEERYTRCTAKPGKSGGLAIGLDGSILWGAFEEFACQLWVSRDDKLMASRPAGSPPVTLVRARREVAVPAEQFVVLRHEDELLFAGFRFRVHVHGTTVEAHPPRRVRALPRVVAIAAAVGGIACGGTVDRPSASRDAAAEVGTPSELQQDEPETTVFVARPRDAASEADVIEIRPTPPD